ncbi:hypothetical protein [Actinoallomurus acaciae]|uniref:Uncharacterized protein n=1 Tax=Actinoallomurus acaciae TaxID=502577 RepID=A0ABV5YHG9_9ACTN
MTTADSLTRRAEGMGELVGIGGVMVPEEAVAPYATAITDIRTRLGIPEGEEIKWRPDKGTFLADAGGELVSQLRRKLLEAAARLGIKSAVVIWDRGRVPWEKERAARAILDYLYERISLHPRLRRLPTVPMPPSRPRSSMWILCPDR